MMDGGIGDHFSRGFWGDGAGLMLCHVPAPQPGRGRGPAGGWQCHRYLCAGGWARTTASPLWGRGSPSAGTSPCGGYRADTGPPTSAGGRVTPAGIWGSWPYL